MTGVGPIQVRNTGQCVDASVIMYLYASAKHKLKLMQFVNSKPSPDTQKALHRVFLGGTANARARVSPQPQVIFHQWPPHEKAVKFAFTGQIDYGRVGKVPTFLISQSL
jgi:hypothetical protein